jgi:enoyl-CoA hydratase/carnithine racemase
MEERIKVEITNGVADVRMVRTDKMNALDDAMFQALIDTGKALSDAKEVRAVVLSGEGKAFCAGLDMGNFSKMASGEPRGGSGLVDTPRSAGGSNRAQHAVMVWRELPMPVIAAVHGVAFGGGFQLCLGADMRFVTADTRMSIMEIKWGLVPDMAGLHLMRHLVRDDIVRELTYTGRQFSGEEALRIGFATRVCADPRAEALALAAEISSKSPHAVRGSKRLLNQAMEASQKDILLLESEIQTSLIGSPNQIEAVMSNMQKRAAAYAD